MKGNFKSGWLAVWEDGALDGKKRRRILLTIFLWFGFRTIIGPNCIEFRGDAGIWNFAMLHNPFKRWLKLWLCWLEGLVLSFVAGTPAVRKNKNVQEK